MARKNASAKRQLDPTREYILCQGMTCRLATREHVELRAYGDSVTLPLTWYLIALKLARPSRLDRACAAFGVDLGEHPEIGRMFLQLHRAGILRRCDDSAPARGEESLRDLLDPAVFGKPSNLKQIAAALRAGRLVAIPNAFRKPVADEVHRALTDTSEWRLHERFSPGFFYRHHNLYDPWVWPPALRRMHAAFANGTTRAFIAELTRQDCSGEPSFSASRYLPGDHSLPHDDSNGTRTVAYVWHLTRHWKPSWGGELYWLPGNVSLAPTFNTLLLFVISKESQHFVTTVAPHARGDRLAVNGWWHNSGPRSKRSAAVGSKKAGAKTNASVRRHAAKRICGGRVVVL